MSLSRFTLVLAAACVFSGGAFAADAPAKPVKAAAKPAAKKKPVAAAKDAAPAKDEVLTVDSLLERADAALAKGQTDDALLLGQAAVVIAPTDPKPYVALGNLYIRANRAEFARGFYDKALDIDPQDSAALAAIAKLGPEKAPQSANGG